MNTHIEYINKNIEPLRQAIINHKIYTAISSLDDLKIFMQYHIYAVWDFMSLLKALQINLTCVSLPWFPKGDALTRQLINEIVAGEESDIDHEGNIKSHFEMYLDAMEQCGADIKPIHTFLNALKNEKSIAEAYQIAQVPQTAQSFVNFTFETVNSNKTHLQAAAFTFGREDLIPDMFFSIINDLNSNQPEKISIFKYYLERHIEVDGDHHSHLALQMTEKLCANYAGLWQEAEQTAVKALQKRIDLWDAAYQEIVASKVLMA